MLTAEEARNRTRKVTEDDVSHIIAEIEKSIEWAVKDGECEVTINKYSWKLAGTTSGEWDKVSEILGKLGYKTDSVSLTGVGSHLLVDWK